MKTASAAFLSSAIALAGLTPLQSAQIDLARNSVKTGGTPLQAGSTLAPGSTLSTGSKAKTQLTVGNNGSVIRAGSKTDLILKNDNTLSLNQGVMLASSGKRPLGRETVAVETPEIKATVKGSMLVAYQPDSYIKITCIEGQVSIKLKAVMGEFVRLQAGQMVIINPASKQLPQEVEVDLQELRATSSLLSTDYPELSATPGMEKATTQQNSGIGKGNVLRTPLVLKGAGLEVTLQTSAGIEPQRTLPPVEPPTPSAPPPEPPPTGGGGQSPPAAPPSQPAEYIIDGQTVFTPSNFETSTSVFPTLQTPGFPVITGILDSFNEVTVWGFHNNNAQLGPELLFRGATEVPESDFGADLFSADGDIRLGDGADTTILWNGSLQFDASGELNVLFTSIEPSSTASSFQQDLGLSFEAGRSVTITGSRLFHETDIAASAPAVAIRSSLIRSGSPAASQSAIDIYSPATSAAQGGILIADSSSLQALASRSAIFVGTDGAPISVLDSTLQAGEVDLDTFNSTADSLLEIRNSVISGDQIRARAFNSGDRDAIIISGSSFNASNLIKFYAEGASKLRFQGNTTLSLGANGFAVLAGRTVEVDNGGNVNISGNADVYRDVDNYNKAGFGNINISGSQNHLPHSSRPAFNGGASGN